MIVAIEGLNGVGKSTLFKALQGRLAAPDVRFPVFKSLPESLVKVQPEVNEREMALFASMYEADKLYISDRFFGVSSFVYAVEKGRKFPAAVLPWVPKTHVVYLQAPLPVLVDRMHERAIREGKPETEVATLFDLALTYDRVLNAMGYGSVRRFDVRGRLDDYLPDVVEHLQGLHSAAREGA